MDDQELNKKSITTLDNLERYERNWHIFKAILVSVTTVIILTSMIYLANRSVQEVNRHVDCIVKLFTIPNRQDKIITNISNCSIGPK